MAKKCKCPEVKKVLTAPFYFVTFSDLMSQLMTFFVLLITMATFDEIKFDMNTSILRGSMGISPGYPFSPMQQLMPAPAIKRDKSTSPASPKPLKSDSKSAEEGQKSGLNGFEVPHQSDEEIKQFELIEHLGIEANVDFHQKPDELILYLPTWGVFDRGSWKIDPNSLEVKRIEPLYRKLAQQLALLSNYDIYFIGHTDSLSLKESNNNGEDAPKTNIDLGFRRATALYDYFFKRDLDDLTRITFASKGDNIPLVPNATLDSERRKNRRVEVHLRRKKLI